MLVEKGAFVDIVTKDLDLVLENGHDECMAITPETLHNVQRSFLNRVDACLLQNRMHVEQFLL
jgi:hypothetical protein